MKYWIFDLDGTLVDSFSSYFKLLETLFKNYGKTFTPDLREPALTDQLQAFVGAHVGAPNLVEAMDWLQTRSNEDARTIRPFEGVPEILKELVDHGMKIAVWTNRNFSSAELILKHSGIHAYIDRYVTGTCVRERKPNPEGFHKINQHFKCRGNEVTIVGDHEHDVLAARAIGARAVRASWHAYWTVDPCRQSDFQFHEVNRFASWVRSDLSCR